MSLIISVQTFIKFLLMLFSPSKRNVVVTYRLWFIIEYLFKLPNDGYHIFSIKLFQTWVTESK